MKKKRVVINKDTVEFSKENIEAKDSLAYCADNPPELQKQWIKDLLCELLDESFEIQTVLDPVEMLDGGFPPWVIIVQVLKYFNQGDKNLDLKIPIRNGQGGRPEILNQKLDPNLDRSYNWEGMHEILEKFRELK